MPWTVRDALRHTKKARSGGAKRQWSKVANAVLRDTGDEGRAVRVANAAVAKRGSATGPQRGRKRSARGRK